MAGDDTMHRTVLADRPFVEAGWAMVRVADARHVVTGGELGRQQWFAHLTPSARCWVLAVHDVTGHRCRALLDMHFPVTALALHPGGRWLVVGTGLYDGDCCFEGELLLVDLAALDAGRELQARTLLPGASTVDALRWLDEQRLEVVLEPPHTLVEDDEEDEDIPVEDLHRSRFVLHRPWELDEEGASVPADAETLPFSWSRDWPGPVGGWARVEAWDVRVLPDHSVLAAAHRVAAERWDAAGQLLWRREVTGDDAIGAGVGLTVLGDRVLATVQGAPPERYADATSQHLLLGLDGALLHEVRAPSPSMAVAGNARVLLRPCGHGGTGPWPDGVVLDAAGQSTATVATGGYNAGVHWMGPTGCPDPLLLVGDVGRGQAVRYARLAGDATLHDLFDAAPPVPGLAHASVAGPAVWLDDDLGRGLVQCVDGRSDSRAPLQLAVRRDATTGQVVWWRDLRAPALAACCWRGLVVVAGTRGPLVLLDPSTGEPRDEVDLHLDGIEATAISLAADGHRLAAGLRDGRILVLDA